MSTVKTVKYQVGTDGTSTNNFTIYQPDPPDGSIRIGVGNADSPTDVMTVNSSGITMASGKTIPASALTGSLPAGMGGKILQVVQTVKTDAFTTTTIDAWVDITGMSVNITPSSTSSKILVMFNTSVSADFAGFRILRDSTEVGSGSAGSRTPAVIGAQRPMASTRVEAISYEYLDSPATTSQITYKIQVQTTTAGTTYINRESAYSDNSTYFATASNITVMEVAG